MHFSRFGVSGKALLHTTHSLLPLKETIIVSSSYTTYTLPTDRGDKPRRRLLRGLLLPGPSSAPPLPWRRRLSPVFSHAFTHEYYVSCTRIHNIHPKFFITLSSLPNFPLASSIHISPLLSSPPAPPPLPACQAISCSNPCMLVHCPEQTHAHSKQTHALSQHSRARSSEGRYMAQTCWSGRKQSSQSNSMCKGPCSQQYNLGTK